MKTIWTIMKKELIRVFKDPKLFLMMFILPGLMIFLVYYVMGDAIKTSSTSELNETSKVFTCNAPNEFLVTIKNPELKFNAEFTEINDEDVLTYKEKLKTKEIDYLVRFDEDFGTKVQNKEKPSVQVYYNSTETRSKYCYELIGQVITAYKEAYTEMVYGDVEVFKEETSNVYDEKTALAKTLSILLPFLIITFLFEGAVSIGPESVAGDKDRGTISTLLATPAKRSHIAIGKLLSLSILAALSAISSFIGVICSLPKMLSGVNLNMSIYSPLDYFLILALLISTVLVVMGIIVVLSAYAKNVKEASMMVTPVMLISMVVGLFTMFSSTPLTSPFVYLIPIFNSVEVLLGVFTFNVNDINLAITLVSNLVYAVILAIVLTREFNSEKIMFSK